MIDILENLSSNIHIDIISITKNMYYPFTPLNGACTVMQIFKDLVIQKWWKSEPLNGA